MHYFAFDKTGAITYDDGPLMLSDKAYSYMRDHGICHIWEMDNLLCRMNKEGVIGLQEEKMLPKEFYEKEALCIDSIFKFRITNFPLRAPELINEEYASFEDVLRKVSKDAENPSETKFLDAIAVYYLTETKPIWTVRNIRRDAATLVATARLEDTILSKYKDEARKGFYAFSSNNGWLYGAVSELLIIKEQIWLAVSIGNTLHFFLKGDESDLEYAAKLLALEKAEKTPLLINDSADESMKRGFYLRKGLNRRSISLTKRYQHSVLNGGLNVFHASGKEGKIKTIVSVSGYIREQPYGAGRKLRKTIWVEGFTRGQWVREGLTEITVSK